MIRVAREFSAEQYLRSPEEMLALFSDIPEALENTVHIAERCSVEIALGDAFLLISRRRRACRSINILAFVRGGLTPETRGSRCEDAAPSFDAEI